MTQVSTTPNPPLMRNMEIAKKPRLGCLARLLVYLLLWTLALIAAVFAPWGFFLGGKFHVLPLWQGIGRLKASSGDYVLYFWISPAPGGAHTTTPISGAWDTYAHRAARGSACA